MRLGLCAIRWWTGLTTLAIATAATSASAQVVRGSVAVPGTAARAAGVVLLLLDSASNESARTLSRQGGAYVLRAPAPGRYRLLARGIGFHPAVTPLFDLRGDTTVAVTLTALPEILPQVTTVERSQCRVGPDSGSAVWTLWEQTSTALKAADITLSDRDNRFRIVVSSRLYALHPPELRTVAFAEAQLRGTRPWMSLPPDTLALRGYVLASDGGLTYVAPDLAVLLSGAFGSTHCLRIHHGAGDNARLVGVDFAPAPGNRHAEIQGTFWLDAASRELRSLEFTYANLPPVGADTLAGGRVEFLRLPTGEWFIPDWTIRTPVAAGNIVVTSGVRVPGIEDLMRARRPAAFRIKRGNVLAVLPPSSDNAVPTWTRPSSGLRVRVTARAHGEAPDAPLAGAVIRLSGSTRQAVTDGAGNAELEGFVEGEYIVEVTTPAYEALFREPERLTILMPRSGIVERRVHVATVEEVVEARCGRMREWSGHASGVLTGTVTREGAPEAGAEVLVEYLDDHNTSRNVLGKSRIKTVDTGTFTVCGVPRDVPLKLRIVTRDGIVTGHDVRLDRDQLFSTEDMAVDTHGPREAIAPPPSVPGVPPIVSAAVVDTLASRPELIAALIAAADAEGTLKAPEFGALWRRSCGADSAPTSDASIIVGRVAVGPSNTPDPVAMVHATIGLDTQLVHADSAGRYLVCARSGASASLRAAHEVLAGTPIVVRTAPLHFVRRDLTVATDNAIDLMWADSTASVERAASAAGGTIAGTVRDPTGRSVENARVRISGVTGEVRTNSGGAFTVRGVPGGVRIAAVEAIGFERARRLVDVYAGDSAFLDLRLPRLTKLGAVTVRSRIVDARVKDLEQRQRLGMGYFFDSTAIQKVNRVYEAISAPGVETVWDPRTGWGAFTYKANLLRNNGRCPMGIYVDGQLASDDVLASYTDNKDIIATIEVYPHAAYQPDYLVSGSMLNNRSDCGMILIWTKAFLRRP